MKPSALRVLAALQRGEKISIHDSKWLSCGAIGQRVGEIKRLGIDVKSDWGRVRGERQAWKVYWIDGAAPRAPRPAPKPEVTIVQSHIRRLNIIEQEQEERQGRLFA